MTARTEAEIEALKRIGKIVGDAAREMVANVRPGITTKQLDAIGERFLAAHGAHSAPRTVYNFPGATCVSINNEAAHGIPGPRAVQPGDLVNIDVSAELDGFFADTGITVPVPPTTALQEKLLRSTRRALRVALSAAQAGRPLNAIGQAIEKEARAGGFQLIRNLTGHGIGRGLHEAPRGIRNYYDPTDRRILEVGMVLAIEPFLSPAASAVYTAGDGWTLLTEDGSLSAQYEHTIVITKGKPLVITAA